VLKDSQLGVCTGNITARSLGLVAPCICILLLASRILHGAQTHMQGRARKIEGGEVICVKVQASKLHVRLGYINIIRSAFCEIVLSAAFHPVCFNADEPF
jgi:hypothetical protein